MKYGLAAAIVMTAHFNAAAQDMPTEAGEGPCLEDATSLACLLSPGTPKLPPGVSTGMVLSPGDSQSAFESGQLLLMNAPEPDHASPNEPALPKRAVAMDPQMQQKIMQGQ